MNNLTLRNSGTYLRVLTYHRIAEPQAAPDLHPRLISATPSVFAAQMNRLAKSYQVVSLAQVLAAVQQDHSLPERAVLITFDDAYQDVGEFAWPVLQRLGLPATIFVPTAYPGHPERAFWWDRLYRAFIGTGLRSVIKTAIGFLPLADEKARLFSLKKIQDHVKTLPFEKGLLLVEQICGILEYEDRPIKSVLDWDELRRLHLQGASLGAHTRTHPILAQSSDLAVEEEILGSQQDLQREIGATWPIFCAPNGSQDKRTLAILRHHDFTLAFTTQDGHNDLRKVDPLQLHRTNITRRTTPVLFRCRLWPAFGYIDQLRHKV